MPTFSEEYHTEDKSDWGNGPWLTEPDKVAWVDKATDLDCMIVRSNSGALCGYVGLTPDHPYYGKGYSKCTEPDCEESYCSHDNGPSTLNAHGGLTFAAGCQPVKNGDHSHGVCHIPGEGRPDKIWWFGFDTAHCWDYMPAMAARERKYDFESNIFNKNCVYRDFNYVISEVQDLAAQLLTAGK